MGNRHKFFHRGDFRVVFKRRIYFKFRRQLTVCLDLRCGNTFAVFVRAKLVVIKPALENVRFLIRHGKRKFLAVGNDNGVFIFHRTTAQFKRKRVSFRIYFNKERTIGRRHIERIFFLTRNGFDCKVIIGINTVVAIPFFHRHGERCRLARYVVFFHLRRCADARGKVVFIPIFDMDIVFFRVFCIQRGFFFQIIPLSVAHAFGIGEFFRIVAVAVEPACKRKAFVGRHGKRIFRAVFHRCLCLRQRTAVRLQLRRSVNPFIFRVHNAAAERADRNHRAWRIG